MPVDAPRYRREVLDPARAAGNRPPDNLVARYQLPEPLTPDGVREALAAVRAHWRTQRATLAYRKVVDALEADDRRLQPVLDAACDGDLGPLRQEITRRHARATDREQALVDELAGLAEPLGLLSPAVVDQVVADGHDRHQVEQILHRLNIEVREPDPLPAEAPVRGARTLREALAILDCRHTADFLFGRDTLASGFTVLDRFQVASAPALRLDQQRVADTARHWQSRLDGKTPAENVLTVLRRLTDPDQLRALLVYECAEDLRRRRDRQAGTAALVNRARELGVTPADTDRLVFAVRQEQARRGSTLAGQLAELLADQQVLAAHRLVAGMTEADLPADAQELAGQATRLAQAATACRDRAEAAASTGDTDAAWRLLDEALAHAPDLPDVDALRRRLPPAPPDRVEVRVDADAVLVSWPPSASRAGELRYRVTRSGRPGPAGHADAVVAETEDTRVADHAPPVNTPLHYAVVAVRDPAAAPPAAAPGPVWFRPDPTELRVSPGEGVVSAAWRTPPGADRVVARRAEGRAPRDVSDGEAVAITGSGFTDQAVETGVTYHYLLVTVYTGTDGRTAHTPGVRFTAVPVAAPEPVPDLTVEQLDGEPGWLRVDFPAPRTGTVEILELDEPPEQAAGTRLATGDLSGRRVPAVPVPGGLKLRAPPPPTILLAVTVNGDQAVIGPHCAWQTLPAPVRLRAQPRGPEVLVTWEWPVEVGEVEVRWRPAAGEVDGGSDAAQPVTVSAARYRTDGGVRLPLPAGTRYQISAAAVVRSAGQRLTGPAATATVALPAVASYSIVRSGLIRRRFNVTVVAETPVRLPQLLLVVTAGELPLRPEDGDVLAGAQDVAAGPTAATVFTVDAPRRPRPYWLRCFARGGPVVLHDPPRNQLRVA